MSQRKPIYLLADSQLLFWNLKESRFIQSIRESLNTDRNSLIRAAYIGAANGDDPDFFQLFTAAMDNIDLHQCQMIHSSLFSSEISFLRSADLILLAGGDFNLGWERLHESGLDQIIVDRYNSGAVLIGVSAGAMHLGMGGYDHKNECIVETLKLVPYFIAPHADHDGWAELSNLVAENGELVKGYGIPAGAGIIHHTDLTLEPLRSSIYEIEKVKDHQTVSQNILFPADHD